MVLIAVVLGFYSYARYRIKKALHDLPEKIGVDIQQTADGFSFSKSDGSHTIFTVRASKEVQYKGGSLATLHDVTIIIYGKHADRYDQIYGSDFEYDQSTGEISAKGEVQIDLQANAAGPSRPDQTQPDEVKNPIHVKTRGLSFNRNTGIARTSEVVEFVIPQGRGSAHGAEFDSNAGTLVLGSEVNFATELRTANRQPSPANLRAEHAVLYQHENQIRLDRVNVREPNRDLRANRVTISLRDDNTIEQVVASGEVELTGSSPQEMDLHAEEAAFQVSSDDHLQSGLLSGNVTVQLKQPEAETHGRADRVALAFAGKNQLESVHASGAVDVIRTRTASATQAADSSELKADGLDVEFKAQLKARNRVDRAVTSGTAQVLLVSPASESDAKRGKSATQTTITAGVLTARFDAESRLRGVHGEPDARVVSSTPGEPDRVSTSRSLDVEFAPSSGAKNADAIHSVVQEGNFHFQEGTREAWAERANYSASTDQLTLTGSPRVAEPQSSATAQEMVFSRAKNEVMARGDVRVTYLTSKTQPGGGMLGGSEAIHVTAPIMVADTKTGVAAFTGGARLWQSVRVVEAAEIEFSRNDRGLSAHGTAQDRVKCSYVANSGSGKLVPITITAAQLHYTDVQRLARFSGGVNAAQEDSALQAEAMDVLLKPANASRGSANSAANGASANNPAGASELDRIIATGNVALEQRDRKANGEKLVYVADLGQSTLTGSPGHPPTLSDAEHGSVTGDSLTFYNRDDRVVIDSGSSRTLTQTRVRK